MKKIFLKQLTLDFTLDECKILKGFAIIIIALHNFCHMLPNACTENEYLYSLSRSYYWLDNFLSGGPHLFSNIFSFWGHYGVSIFLFLSGFGLVRKYESSTTKSLRFLPFMKKQYLKLWKLLLPAVFLCIILYLTDALSGNARGMKLVWIPVLLTFTSNLIPNSNLIYGPWWFFSLIIQCYCIYALLFYKKNTSNLYKAMFISLLIFAILILTNTPDRVLCYFKLNIFGWILPFAFGIICARKTIKIPLVLSVLSLFIFILCEFNNLLWLISPLFLCLGLKIISNTAKVLSERTFLFFGSISSYIFVLHPLTRSMTFHLFNSEIYYYTSLCFYIVLTLLFTYIYKLVSKRLPL